VTSEHVYQCGKDGTLAALEDLCKEEAVKIDTPIPKVSEVEARKSDEDTPKDDSLAEIDEDWKEENLEPIKEGNAPVTLIKLAALLGKRNHSFFDQYNYPDPKKFKNVLPVEQMEMAGMEWNLMA
jgi:hypothetical protein